jgi:cytochrome P450
MPKPGIELAAVMDDGAFYAGDPHAQYARLRAEAPIAWNDALGYWVASRHAEVMAVSRDSNLFCSGRGILTFEIGVDYPSPPTMMHTDPPDHTNFRKLVQPAFRPSLIAALAAPVRARARALVDTIEAGVPVDFTERVAVPLPLQVIADFLGVPDARADRFFEWSEASIPGATDWPPEKIAALQQEMREYLLELTLSRRGQDSPDLTTVLANSSVDGEALSDEAIVMFQNQLLVAGNETTRNMMSAGLWATAERPDQWQRLVDDPTLIGTAVEEWLRWSTPVIAFMRTATRDTELAGVPIAAGEPVLMLYASANRDEAEFGPTADRFDVGREPNHHVAFGFGAHFCIGAALARLEARVLIEELLARFRTVEPAGEIVRSASPIIAGVKSTPVVFG